jgi:hypothetical protein
VGKFFLITSNLKPNRQKAAKYEHSKTCKNILGFLCVLAVLVGMRWDGLAQAIAVPPGAAALGYTNCVINQSPTASDIAPGNNGNYKWFNGQYWATPPSHSSYSTVSNVLVLNFSGTNLDLVSTPRDFSTGVLPILTASNGFYVEFDVRLSDNNSDHWPGVWLMPVEHNFQMQDCYPGDPAKFERWMELDVDEGGWGPGLLGTVHAWTGIWTNYVTTANPNNLSLVALDRSKQHTFGASYNPANQQVSWWVDGVLQMRAITPYVPAVALQQHYYLILSTYSHGQNKPYSMYVSGIRVYIPKPVVSPPQGLRVVQTIEYTLAN